MSKYYKAEDVIQRLDNAIYEANRGAMGYDEALKRLRVAYSETMPTIEVNEDCISREGVLFAVEEEIKEWEGTFSAEGMKRIKTIIETIPSVIPQVPNDDAISRERFREQMYHRCFEVDNDPNMQKWESGNWIRWKLFEEELEKAPSIIP